MKVVHCWLVALIGVVLSASCPPVLASDAARQLRVREGVGAAAVEPQEATVVEDEGEGGGRNAAAACGQLSCPGGHLHLLSLSMFVNDVDERGETMNRFIILANAGFSVCASKLTEPTVLVLAHLKGCEDEIGSVKFDLFKDGVRIRRYAEKAWPYTVFGDTTSPFTVNSRVLAVGSYAMSVDIKDPNGCVMAHQNYRFTIADC